jgi:RNA polymerase sigma-70 factor (ECF subfamily)
MPIYSQKLLDSCPLLARYCTARDTIGTSSGPRACSLRIGRETTPMAARPGSMGEGGDRSDVMGRRISVPVSIPLAELSSLSDEQLVANLAAGHHDALTVLFARHSALVFRIARRMLRDDGEAEETVQQVFFDVYRAIKQFNPDKASFKVWLLQFAFHRTFNRKQQLQSQHVFDWKDLDEVLPELFREAGRPLQLSSQELAYLVRQLLAELKPRQREVIISTFFEGLTAEEIASRSGESAAVVRHNLYRGLAKLRSALVTGGEERSKSAAKTGVAKEVICVAYPRPL